MNRVFAAALMGCAVTIGGTETVSAGVAGGTLYDAQCSVCHQSAGAGVPGSFPRLAGRAGALANLAAGRNLMISAVLYGMAGKVQLDGQTIVGVMPPLAQLSDADIAAVLNYVAHLDHRAPKPFTAAEVAEIRGHSVLTSSEVNALAVDAALVKAAP